MLDERKIRVTSSPHIKTEDSTRSIMVDVVIALMPALAISVFTFGFRVLSMLLICVLSCVLFEWIYERLLKKPITISDGSAVVTGILLAFCLPVLAPVWVPVIGAAFAIIVVKQLYGGIGKNFMNPALAARAFLFSWPVIMTTWAAPRPETAFPLFATPIDAVTAATPLAQMKTGVLPDATALQLALGQIGGSMGEVSAFALLAGGLYLLYRRVITARIPLAFIGVVFFATALSAPPDINALTWGLTHILSGGVMLGAIFMATDYTTSPVSPVGQWVFGIGCGLITVFIRYFGSYPEGVCYSILIMNALSWLIDKNTRPKKFGHSRPEKGGVTNG